MFFWERLPNSLHSFLSSQINGEKTLAAQRFPAWCENLEFCNLSRLTVSDKMSLAIVRIVMYVLDMMSNTELDDNLAALRVSPAEAAQLLGVSARTLRRWLEGEAVPGPAEAALRAWRTLAGLHLPWKPDAVSIFEDDQDQIARHRQHTEEMAAVLKKVEARGGAKNPWTVNLQKCTAIFGHFEVGFYTLQSGGILLEHLQKKRRAARSGA